jgi:tetratricopeptide (TPR) repeat protein
LKRIRGVPILLGFLFLFQMFPGFLSSDAAGQEASSTKERAEALAEEAQQLWDRKEYPRAIGKFRESLALDPKGETYRDLGDLYAEQDMHPEAIEAFRSAIRVDPSLEPELRLSIGEQLLWAYRPREAAPLLESVVANRPHDIETKRHLAMAYRLGDRLKKAEALYRELLRGNPSDTDARKGLAASLLWQGRFRAATVEFEQVLSGHPSDAEALEGLSSARCSSTSGGGGRLRRAGGGGRPKRPDAREQIRRVRERLARRIAFEGSVAKIRTTSPSWT